MTFDRRLQRYLRGTAARGREVVRVGPFTAFLNPRDGLRFLNYAIPEEGAAPTPDEAAALAEAFAAHDRLARLEYVESEAPALAPALEAAGYRREATLDVGMLAALDGDDAAAGVFTVPADGLTELAGIGTLPAFRRRGIAAALTGALAAEAFARGVEIAFLTPGDDDTRRVYERAGFRATSTVLAYAQEAPP